MFGRLVFTGAFAVAAAATAVHAAWDMRAASARDALMVLDRMNAGDPARSLLLADAEGALAGAVVTADLADLGAAVALRSDPPQLDEAARYSHDALRRAPASSETWARLAYIEVARTGRLGESGLEALANSYAAAPFADRTFRHWRMEFALFRWDELSEPLRERVLDEARMAAGGEDAEWVWLYELHPRLSGDVQDVVERVLSGT